MGQDTHQKKIKFDIPEYTDLELQKARELIYLETEEREKERKEREKESKERQDGDGNETSEFLLYTPIEKIAKLWEDVEQDVAYLPTTRSYGLLSTTSEADRLKSYEQQFELLRDQLSKEMMKAQKVENVVDVLLGGYQERARKLRMTFQDLHDQLDDSISDLSCFEMLSKKEDLAIPNRANDLQGVVDIHKKHEKELQERYKLLAAKKAEMQALVE